MRTKKELQSSEFNDSMDELEKELKEAGIEYTKRPHPGANRELIRVLGYYPTGAWQILIGEISVIRGMASFGFFEAYRGKYTEPERFKTAKELVADLKK